MALLFSSCALPTNAPLKFLFYPRPPDDRSRGLIVFLQGRGGNNTDFAEHGFVEAINRRQLPFDMMAPDAHMGYYMGETLVPRLKHDLIEPANISGYHPVWLVGVSMGGLGALMYLREHPADIAGVCIISPFLGYPGIISEISAAGSLAAWDPGQFEKSVPPFIWGMATRILSYVPTNYLPKYCQQIMYSEFWEDMTPKQ
ncbi:MAG: alpha/beta hydrolase family protein [Acidobacteria bacterium]|nr:alpha/beta hydrolase family protein [Acidobacteriota bacterium]